MLIWHCVRILPQSLYLKARNDWALTIVARCHARRQHNVVATAAARTAVDLCEFLLRPVLRTRKVRSSVVAMYRMAEPE